MRWSPVLLLIASCGAPREAEEAHTAPPASAMVPEPKTVAEPKPAGEPEPAAEPEPSAEPEPAPAVVPLRARKVASTAIPGLQAFSTALESEGALWIGQLSGNGGRDVVVFVPAAIQPRAAFELVVHFHGTYSENISEPTTGVPKKAWVGWDRLQQAIDAITELQTKRAEAGEANVALVYPISAGKRMEPSWRGWSNKMYDRMWMTPVPDDPRYNDEFDTLLEQASVVLERELGVPAARVLPTVRAEGHSAGGIALRNVAVAGTSRVSEYLFLDASFQDWSDGCFAAVRDQGQAALVSLVITQGGIADPFGKRDPWCTRLEEASRTWPEVATGCEGKPQRRTGFGKLTCEAHAEAAQDWPDYADWCQGMKNDMKDEPGVFVFRTKVPHGKQPRQFVGGLALPQDRLRSGE